MLSKKKFVGQLTEYTSLKEHPALWSSLNKIVFKSFYILLCSEFLPEGITRCSHTKQGRGFKLLKVAFKLETYRA
jgi:hypothetical protein